MSLTLVLVRAAVCYATWIALGALLVRRSRQAVDRDDHSSRAAAARAGVWFLAGFAPTFSVWCFDWVLSLDRHFSSTIFALYHFAGLFLSGVAIVTVLAIVARRRGTVRLGEDALHDLGKLLFAFTLFWAYLWFSQYLLIWYTNEPEETAYYLGRHAGGFEPLAVANVLLNWAIPFAMLLSAHAKRRETMLLRACALVLAGRALDLYLGVQGAGGGESPPLRLWDVALPLGAVGAFLWSFRRAFERSTRERPPPQPLHGAHVLSAQESA